MSETATGLQVWVDKLELTELVGKLASAIDRANREQIIACYAEESFDDHGVFRGSGTEFADYICNNPAGPDFKMHHLVGQSLFELHGDEAWGESYLIYNDVSEAGNGYGFARYIDYFQRIDGTWKVKYRRVVTDKTVEGYDISTYWASTRDASDPVYDHRKWPDS